MQLGNWCKGKINTASLYALQAAVSEYKEIHEAFIWTNKKYPSKQPRGIKDFFLCLSKPSPVCSYLYPSEECFSLLEKLFIVGVKSQVSTMRDLHNKLPIFFDLLTSMEDQSSLPFDWKPVAYKLMQLAGQPFTGPKLIEESAQSGDEKVMSYFPTLPMLRRRGRYVMDAVKDETICTKNYPSHQKLTSGIFTLYCIHGMSSIVWYCLF